METRIIKKPVNIDNLKPGMKLLNNITEINDRILVTAGTILDSNIISKIKNLSYYNSRKIYVETEIMVLTQKEQKIKKIHSDIENKFAKYKDSKFYNFIKKLSLQSSKFLIDKKPELYEYADK
jgi:hypothetical protein